MPNIPLTSLKFNKNIIAIIFLAIAIFCGGLLIINGVNPLHKDKVATGFLFDILITFPLCYYFVIIRPLKKSYKNLFFVLTICCGIAYLLLPEHQRMLILQVRKLSMLAELIFIFFAIIKFKKVSAVYKLQQSIFADPLYNLRYSMCEIFGEVLFVKILSSELAVFRYGLLFWKKEKPVSKQTLSFSIYKESGYVAIWCIILLAIIVEVIAFHLLLMRWNKIAATAITFLTLYGTIFFIADLSAIIKRKILINNETLILRTGLRWRAIVEICNIESIKKINIDTIEEGNYLNGGVIKTSGNLFVAFKSEVIVEKLYGQNKSFKAILMNIDDADRFIDELNNRFSNKETV